MRRLVRSVLLAAAILVTGCLAAGCVESASGATTSPSPTASAPATVTTPPPPTTAPPSPTPSAASPTVAPSTAPATPASSSPASSTGSSFNLIWLWVILGAAVLVGIIVFATRSPGGSDEAVLWRSRTAHTYEQGGAFDNAVREGERQGAYLDRNGAAWHHIQNRETLHARLAALESSLNALRVPNDPLQ
jgi:ABC-type transport system substrate-binding protein